ncbi:LysM peptidoglycan-binding domain-containing protein [Streptomyces sp. NPDC000878]
MPHSPTPVRRRGRSWPRTVLRGLFALAALIAGVPALLLAVGTLPATLPTLDSARQVLLSADDDGSGLLTTMTVAAWIAWLWLVIPVLTEVAAVMARRTTPQLPGMATGQRLAGFLLGSIVLASPAAAASAATPALAATAPHAPPADRATNSQHNAPAPNTTSEKAAPDGSVEEVTVGAEDTTWWELAEQWLGDGSRYTELQRLNPDIPTTASVVPQGTTVRVPTRAEVPGDVSSAGLHTHLASSTQDAAREGDADVVTVEPGDSLSQIAVEELHDGTKWPLLFDASRGTTQPDGLPSITDPDMIYPGQQVTVPEAASERPDRPREGTGDGSSTGNSTAPDTDDGEKESGGDTGGVGQPPTPDQSAPSQAESPAPSGSRSSPSGQPGEGAESAAPSSGIGASSTPSSDATPTPAASTAPPSQKPASTPTGQGLQLRIVLGAGALLAAAVTGALAARRMLQRRRRKPGETIAIASETSSAEAQLAAAAEPTGAARLDAALRTLAHQVEDGAGMPGLRAARIGERSLEVLPEDLSQEPTAPFTAGHGDWWVLPDDAQLLDEETAREVPAPYPGLVTMGSTEAGDLLLLNLTPLPALLLAGDPAHVTEVCTSLALELGMSPWADVEIVTVGFGEDLPQLLPTTRIAHMRQATHALRDLSERLLEAHQMPDTRQQPYLLLCASLLDTATAWEFADVIDKSGSVPVTLVAPARTTTAYFPDAAILNASLDEPQRLDHAGIDITLQRLERAAYVQIATALKVSGQPPQAGGSAWQEVPDEPDRMRQPGQPAPNVSVTPTTSAAASPSPAAATDVSAGVYPALLAATTNPSGLRLLPPAAASPQAESEHNPRTETAWPPGSPTPAATQHPEENDEGAAEETTAQGAHESETLDLDAPEIRVLGPVEVTGVDSTGHGPRMAQLAALLFFRPGRSAHVLCSDMDPVSPWSVSTLNARLQGLRRCLGNDPAGNPYVPRRSSGDTPYRLSPTVRCDWTRFLQLAERALPLGPAGLTDLEKALALVRGRPFGDKPLPWAEPFRQEMITRIIDIAHTIAAHRTPAGPDHDLSAARRAISTGLDVDDTAELLYRDWMRIEHTAGNRQGVHTAIARVQQINQALDCDLETSTEHLINELLQPTPPPHVENA